MRYIVISSCVCEEQNIIVIKVIVLILFVSRPHLPISLLANHAFSFTPITLDWEMYERLWFPSIPITCFGSFIHNCIDVKDVFVKWKKQSMNLYVERNSFCYHLFLFSTNLIYEDIVHKNVHALLKSSE